MKTKANFFLMIALVAVLTSSCIVNAGGTRGNGKISMESRDASAFNSIKVAGSANVIIEQGGKHSITVETDENIMSLIETKISGGELTIDTKESVSPTKLNIYLMLSDIKDLRLVGSGDIFAKYRINADAINLSVSGSGDIKLKQLIAKSVKANVSGSGDIEVAGKSETAELKVVGSGDIEMKHFDILQCDAEVVGSGDIAVKVQERLRARVVGSGDIVYWGSPKEISRSTSGSGSIKQGK